jgi:hypothetical protein
MSIFHPFPRLPDELRQRIWELGAQQPREVAIRFAMDGTALWPTGTRYCYSPTKVPALLHACAESRSYLQGSSIYSKAFKEGSQPRYTWVNFDVDTIRMVQGRLMTVFAELNSIRQLTIECVSYDSFCEPFPDGPMHDLEVLDNTGLRTLTLIDMAGPSGRVRGEWWQDWCTPFMEGFYYTCAPPTFYTRVVAPNDPNGIEVNSKDYIAQYRAYRKALIAADPEYWYEHVAYEAETESEDGRERWFGEWVHTDSCNCINRP